MSPAPLTAAPPEIERFLAGLIEANILDAERARGVWDEYQRGSGSSDVAEVAEFLIGREWLTAYQAECAVAGEAGRARVGPYLLLEPTGAGRFGSDFSAIHRGDRRRYTVKLLPLRSLWSVHQAKRLANRFRSLPLHRAVVPLAEIDTASGSLYLSWLQTEGETFDALPPLPPHTACRLFAEVAGGLALCHAAGIFHGMLAPSNLAVGADGFAKILDWGLGVLLAENPGEESMFDTMSRANSARETMAFTAPECFADPSIRSAAADAYALGCVLYAALAGAPPFPDDRAVEIMIAHRTRMPEPVRTLNPSVPAALDDLIASLLQKAPETRPGLREVREILESLAAGLPVEGPSTIPFGAHTLGVGQLEALLNDKPVDRRSDPVIAGGYKASQIFESSEGRIDFDVPADGPSAETPPFHLRTPTPAPTVPAAVALTADGGESLPVLLLPVPGLPRTLSLPHSAAAAANPKPATPPPPPLKTNWTQLPAPVNWVSASAKSASLAVRPAVELPPPPNFSSGLVRGLRKQLLFWMPVGDAVQLSVFGAPEVAAGQRVNFLVYAHSPETYSSVLTLCRAMRPDAELLGAGYLDVPVSRGADVNLHLALSYAGVAKSLVNFTWIGQSQHRTFEVFVPWESPPGLASGVITAGIDKTMVASIPLHFIIPGRRA